MKVKPSEYEADFWIGIDSPFKKMNPELRDNSFLGKWLIFISSEKIDQAWELINKETEQDNLGFSAKVSTKLGWIRNGKKKDYVICIHTKDYRDVDDVFRVRQKLLDLGFTKELNYKTDRATFKNEDTFLYTK